MKTLVEENYLKALYNLSEQNDEVSVNELSKVLNIKMPTVTGMMRKFDEKKWILYKRYKPIKLTDLGKKEAALIVRKHRLTEMFLTEKMGIGWESVHEIAEQIEHIKSPLFFEKMDEILNHPKLDPHGSPIPDGEGNIQKLNYYKLSDCEVDERLIFRAVTHASDDFLKFLNEISLQLGTKIKVKAVYDFDQSREVKFLKQKMLLSKEACEMILVEKIKSK